MSSENSETESKVNGSTQPEGPGQQAQQTSYEGSTSGASCQMNGACMMESLKSGLELAKKVVMDPLGVWVEIKDQNWSVAEMYQKYIIPLSAIPVVASFIGFTLFGPVKLFSGLLHAILSYGIHLGMIYVMAFILHKLAPQFGGACTLENAMKLAFVSSLPGIYASVVMVVPFALLVFIPLLAALGGLYAFYLGIPTMTGVPTEKRLPYFAVLVGTLILTSLLLEAIF